MIAPHADISSRTGGDEPGPVIPEGIALGLCATRDMNPEKDCERECNCQQRTMTNITKSNHVLESSHVLHTDVHPCGILYVAGPVKWKRKIEGISPQKFDEIVS